MFALFILALNGIKYNRAQFAMQFFPREWFNLLQPYIKRALKW